MVYEEPELLSVTVLSEEGTAIVTATGEIDGSNAETLRQTAADVIDTGHSSRIVLDLVGIQFFNSAGVAVVADAHAQARARGVTLALVAAPSGRVMRTLDIMGLTALLPTYPTLAAALKA